MMLWGARRPQSRDSGYSASLSQSSAANGAIGTGIAAKNAAKRAADPPDPNFRKVSAVNAYPIHLVGSARRLLTHERLARSAYVGGARSSRGGVSVAATRRR